MVAPSTSTAEGQAPPYRIKRKPPPTIDAAEKYPPADPEDPFAPLWVLRNRTSSMLGQNPIVSSANPSPYTVGQAGQDNDQSNFVSKTMERRRSNSYLYPATNTAAELPPPRRASPSPVPRSGSPSPRAGGAQPEPSPKSRPSHYRRHSQVLTDGVPATPAAAAKPEAATGPTTGTHRQRQHLGDVSTVTAATVGTLPPTSRDPRPAKASQSKPQDHRIHLPLQGHGHVRRPAADTHADGSGTETESDASNHAVAGVLPSSVSKAKLKTRTKPDSRTRTVSPSPLRHGGSTGGEALHPENAGTTSQPTQPGSRQLPTPDTTVTTSSSGTSRFAKFLVSRKGSQEGSSGYAADGEKRRLKTKHRGGAGGKVAISAPIASTFVHHQGNSDFGGHGRTSSEDERGVIMKKVPFANRHAESDNEGKAPKKTGLADLPASASISRRASPLPPHMADISSVSMNATMANSFDLSMSLGVLVERSFEMSEPAEETPPPEQEPPKTLSKTKPERHNTEMSWAEVNEEDYSYFSKELAANSTLVHPGSGPLSSPPLPPIPSAVSSTPSHGQRQQQTGQTQRTSESDLYPTPAPSPAPSLNGDKEKPKEKYEDLTKKVSAALVIPELASTVAVSRAPIHRGRDEETRVLKATVKGQAKTTTLPTPPLTAHVQSTNFFGPSGPAPPPKLNKRRLSSNTHGHPPPAPSTQPLITVETAAPTALTTLNTKVKDLHLQTHDLTLPSAHSIGNTSLVNVSISTPLAAREDQETKPREEETAYVMPRRAPRPPKGEEAIERKEEERKEREKMRLRRRVEAEREAKKVAEEAESRAGVLSAKRVEKGDDTGKTSFSRAKHVKSASASAPVSGSTKPSVRDAYGHATCTTSVSGPVHLPSSEETRDAPPLPHSQALFTKNPVEMPTSASKEHWHASTAPEYALPTVEQIAHAASLPLYNEEGRQLRFGSLFEARKTVVVFIRHFWCPLCQDYMTVVSEVVKPDMLVATLNVDDDEVVWTGKDRGQERVDFIIISNGAHGMITKYRQMFKLPFKIYTDPTLALYKALGMGKDGSVKDHHNAQCHSDSPLSAVKEKKRFYSRKRGDSSSSAAAVMGVGAASDRENCESSCSAGGGGTSKKGYVRHGLMSGIAMVVVRAIKVGMPVWEKGGDVGQLGGEFVFGPGLTCSFAHRMQTTKGHAPIQEVLQAAGVRLPVSSTIPPSPPAHSHAVPRAQPPKGHMQSQSVDLASLSKDVSATGTAPRRRRESLKAFQHSIGRSNGPPLVPTSISGPISVQAHSHAQKMARRDSRRHEGSVAIPPPMALPAMMLPDEEDRMMEERQRTYDKLQEKKNVRRVGAIGRASSKQGGTSGVSANVQLELRLGMAGHGGAEAHRTDRKHDSYRSRGQHGARPLEEDKIVYKAEGRR